MKPIVYRLSNTQYHRGEEERTYLSSSLLKKYRISPAAYKYALENPEPETDAMRFGSLFHDVMAALADGAQLCEALDAISVFEPPVSPRTGKPYGATSDKWREAYNAFTESLGDSLRATAEEFTLVSAMVNSLLNHCGSTSGKIREWLREGKPEVSFFYESEDGIRMKCRPDLLSSEKEDNIIVDWKTVNTDNLSDNVLRSIIHQYDYHISAAMYQYVVRKILRDTFRFIIVFVSKKPPHEARIVDMCEYAYDLMPGTDIPFPGPAVNDFLQLLDLHISCSRSNLWPTAGELSEDPILRLTPPSYYIDKFS